MCVVAGVHGGHMQTASPKVYGVLAEALGAWCHTDHTLGCICKEASVA